MSKYTVKPPRIGEVLEMGMDHEQGIRPAGGGPGG